MCYRKRERELASWWCFLLYKKRIITTTFSFSPILFGLVEIRIGELCRFTTKGGIKLIGLFFFFLFSPLVQVGKHIQSITKEKTKRATKKSWRSLPCRVQNGRQHRDPFFPSSPACIIQLLFFSFFKKEEEKYYKEVENVGGIPGRRGQFTLVQL